MEPGTADPSLLTDTATSDTTGSVGSVGSVVTIMLVVGGADVSVGAMVVGSMNFCG